MGKKIVFLEDKPKRLAQIIPEMIKRNEIERVEVLYYAPEISQDSDEVKELEKELKAEVKVLNLLNFDKILDELYAQPDNLFVFDTVLTTNPVEIEIFEYRVNVSYALRKREQLTKPGQLLRIWFYTVAGLNYQNSIDELFGEYALQAKIVEDNLKIGFDENETFVEALQSR